MSVKEQVLQAIQRLPDDIDYRDVTDEIAFLAATGEAEQDIAAGRVVTNEQMKGRIGQWSQWAQCDYGRVTTRAQPENGDVRVNGSTAPAKNSATPAISPFCRRPSIG